MSAMIRANGQIISIEEEAIRLNAMGLAAGEFSEAMHVFNLEYPFEVAIMSGDICEGLIRRFSQEIAEAEAV